MIEFLDKQCQSGPAGVFLPLKCPVAFPVCMCVCGVLQGCCVDTATTSVILLPLSWPSLCMPGPALSPDLDCALHVGTGVQLKYTLVRPDPPPKPLCLTRPLD